MVVPCRKIKDKLTRSREFGRKFPRVHAAEWEFSKKAGYIKNE